LAQNWDIGQNIGKHWYLGILKAKYQLMKHISKNISIGLAKNRYQYQQTYQLENIGIGISSTHIGLTLAETMQYITFTFYV
jgi:hypothetical protein